MLKLLAALGLTLSLLFMACGGDDDDGASSPGDEPGSQGSGRDEDDGGEDDEDDGGDGSDFHACSLFTAEEIGAVVNAEVTEGRDYLATGPGATQCTWEVPNGTAGVFIEVLLDGGQDWYDSVHNPAFSTGAAEEVDGLGDVAVWDSFLGTLDVVDGDAFVAVQPIGFSSERDDKDVAIELAEMTLERLP